MIEKAKKKIQEEKGKSKDANIQTIGDYLLKQIEINIDAAEKINNKEKTLSGAFKVVTAKAKKKAVNGCAVLSDEEVYGIVREYFGFEAAQHKMFEVEAEEIQEAHKINDNSTSKSNIDFDVDLEDLL